MKEHLPVLLAVFKQILKALFNALAMNTFASKKHSMLILLAPLMCGVEQGVAVLHENDIIHYDLKCDNVMVEVNKKCPGSNLPRRVNIVNIVSKSSIMIFQKSSIVFPYAQFWISIHDAF